MTMRWTKNHGKPVVRVDFGVQANGKRRVRFFPDEKQAKAAMSKYEKDREAIGKRWANLPVEERLGVVTIIDEIKAAGMSLQSVWQAFQSEKLKPLDASKVRTLKAAIDEMIQAKR